MKKSLTFEKKHPAGRVDELLIVKNKHVNTSIANIRPKFPLRPVWIGCHDSYALNELVGVHLPEYFFGDEGLQRIEECCRRLVELGFNAIILGSRKALFTEKPLEKVESLSRLVSIFHEHGLKVIIKADIYLPADVSHCPYDTDFQCFIRSSLQFFSQEDCKIDGLFWESAFLYQDYHRHKSGVDATQAEKVSLEIKLIEGVLGKKIPLFYYLPTSDFAMAERQGCWFKDVCDEVLSTTTLVFSYVSGQPWQDYEPIHPFWNLLRSFEDSIGTRLMPILNVGDIDQGKGFWPNVAADLIGDCLSRCTTHPFSGVISLVEQIPKSKALLECSLWAAAQSQSHQTPPQIFVESWFAKVRPDLNYLRYSEALLQTRKIIIQIGLIRSLTHESNRDKITQGECRLIAESLLAQLKYLQHLFDKEKTVPSRVSPSLKDYFTFFVRDARRIILHFLQCYNVSMPQILSSDDFNEGIWTAIEQGEGQGFRSMASVHFLSESNSGKEGSFLRKVYNEIN